MTTFEQTFEELPLAGVHDLAAARHAEGWRYVQILAVNTEEGIDLVYSYMKDGHLANFNVSGVKQTDVVPSITDLYLEAFVCENEIHDLFDVAISDIAIDFGGMFYQLAEKAPMTVVSPEQLAAREKAKKIAAAKAGKHGVQVVEARGDAGELVAVGTAQLLHGVDNFQDGFPDGLDAGFIAAAADVINLLFGAFQQHVGILAGGCLAQNAAGGFDQAAGLILFPDDL